MLQRGYRIGYLGSPDISAHLLRSILDAGRHEVAFVLSNPDRPRGRSSRLHPTEVSALALERDIPLFRPESLKKGEGREELVEQLQAHDADLFVVFAYGKILPSAVYELPSLGAVNLHASLLPLLRGASPIQSALLHGLETTGWSVQKIAKGMDTGDVLATAEIPIDPEESAGELAERMLPEGVRLMLDVLERYEELWNAAQAQDESRASYCTKFTTEMSVIDWALAAQDIHNLVRALNPRPTARTQMPDGSNLKIHRTALMAPEAAATSRYASAEPGTFGLERIDDARKLVVRAGDSVMEILELQPEGRKKLTAQDFLNGYRAEQTERFPARSGTKSHEQ